jgi:ribosomal protein S18 acetylase RimI-like enzyme
MIRHAKISEIPDILDITGRCAALMIQNDIYQWNNEYPSQGAFEIDIERNELFLLEQYAKVMGTVVISTLMDDEYAPVEWLTPSSNNIYVHRLAVDPEFQGKGFAQKLMDFAENFARKNAYISIRLDTFSQNKRNQKFYEERGYVKLEDIFYPKQSDHPFHCYELVL